MRWIAKRLFMKLLFGVAHSRRPDVVIGGHLDPYMLRWWVIPKNRFFNIYLHDFRRSDDDRALHDHPWMNLSFLLHGTYAEHTILPGGIHRRVQRQVGDLKFRMPTDAHRVELTDGNCWSLFITGPKVREWGFHCPKGWVWWENFTAKDETGSSIYAGGCDDGA